MNIEYCKQNLDSIKELNLSVSEKYNLSKKMNLNEISNKGFQTISLGKCTYDFDLALDNLVKVEKQNLETDKYRHLVGFLKLF